MAGMFEDAISFNQPLDAWDVSSVTSLSWMFAGAISFNQPLNNWNVSAVQLMDNMFKEASSFDQPLSDWNVSSVIEMSSMFAGAISFDQSLQSWNISSVGYMSSMFTGVTLNTQYYDAMLKNWSSLSLQSDVILDMGNTQFSNTGQIYRNTIISEFHWQISDGGIQDNINPIIINKPNDLVLFYGNTSQIKFMWQVGDQNPGTYKITQNGTEMIHSTWSNGSLEYNVSSGLPIGVYYYRITLLDLAGNSVSDNVTLTIKTPLRTTIATQSNKNEITTHQSGLDYPFSPLILGMVISFIVYQKRIKHNRFDCSF